MVFVMITIVIVSMVMPIISHSKHKKTLLTKFLVYLFLFQLKI